jgi:transposase-like protein
MTSAKFKMTSTRRPNMPTFLMKCPKCGKHFDVERTADRVETKEEVVKVDTAQEHMRENIGPVYIPSVMDQADESSGSEQESRVAETVTHNETFRCKHCGYTWKESRAKRKT